MSAHISRATNGDAMSAGSLATEQLEQCVRSACSEMGRQWREGHPVLAEDVLAQMPDLAEHNELALELIYTEYVIREELGQQCSHEEWFKRFPRWTTDLMQLLEVHRQLCEAETVQTAGSKWQELSTAGSTADPVDPPHSTDGFPQRLRKPPVIDDEQVGRLVGNYQLLEEIGRGGMGVVYRARQLNLSRDVALKMILSGEFAGSRELIRFQTEAMSTARLHHPNIVQVYEVGAHHQRPFLSMELISGGNLDGRLKQGLPAPRDVAELLSLVAKAVHYAHEHGVIHRDLKPCNILLDEHAQPKVADFGLAKQLQEGQHECSRSMGPVGTPSYMAPETVAGSNQRVTPATDVYSLGVILYETLTGKPPFVAETQLETLRQIVNDEPTAPTLLNRRVPHDLETICLKCLQKEPRRRYSTAQELADDLQRYLRREPIRAKRVSALERCLKWTRRRPLEAAFLTFLGVSFICMFALWRSAVASDYKARLSAEVAVRNRELAEREKDHVQRNDYFLRVGQAEGEYLKNMVGRANELLDECPESMRHFEWNYLKRKCSAELLTMKGHKDLLCIMAITRDGKFAATGSGEWGTNRAGDIIIWDLQTGKEVLTISPQEGPIMSLDFSPDGQYLASSSFPWDGLKSPGVKIWNRSGELVWRLPAPADGSKSIKFSPDGRCLAVAGGNGRLQVWHIQQRKLLRNLPGHDGMVLDIAFDPSGTRIATAGRDGKAAIYNWLTGDRTRIDGEYFDLRWIRFSPDGRYLAFSNFGKSIWKVDLAEYLAASSSSPANPIPTNLTPTSPTPTSPIPVGTTPIKLVPVRFSYEIGTIESFEYSPEGRRIALCSHDGSVLIVNAEDGVVLQRMYTHNGMVRSVFFTTDNRLVTAASEGTVKVWNLDFDRPNDRINTGGLSGMGSIARLRITNDGQHVMMTIVRSNSWGRGYQVLLVYDLKTFKNVAVLYGHDGYLTDVAESPDGDFWATSSLDKTVRIWNAKRSKQAKQLKFTAQVSSVRFDQSGKHIIAACSDGTIHVRDWKSGESICQWNAHQANINEIDLSPDGQLLASCSDDTTTKIWNLASGELIRDLNGHSDRVLTLAFSHSGRLLCTGSADQTLKVWSVARGAEVQTLRAHLRQVDDLDFSSDDQRIVSCGREGFIKVWDVESGREAISLRDEANSRCVAFHPSNQLIISAHDRTVQLFDARAKEHAVPDEEFALRNYGWNMDQARKARELGLSDVARINYAQVADLVPIRDYDYRRRGHARATLERWPEAISDYSMAFRLGNNDPELLPALVMANLTVGDQDNCRYYAIPLAERAIQIHSRKILYAPDILQITSDIHAAIMIQQRPPYAERLLGIMSDLAARPQVYPELRATMLTTLALLYYRCGWMEEAEALMQDRPVDQSATAEDWSIRALLAMHRNDFLSAATYIRRAENLCPESLLAKQTNQPEIKTWLNELGVRLLLGQARRQYMEVGWLSQFGIRAARALMPICPLLAHSHDFTRWCQRARYHLEVYIATMPPISL